MSGLRVEYRKKFPSASADNWIAGVGAGVFLVLAVVLARQVAARRALHQFSIREGVLALCGVTVACSIITISAAACSALRDRIVNALFDTCVAASQGVNGYLTLERYLVLHPHMKVSTLNRVIGGMVIVAAFILPFFMDWVLLLFMWLAGAMDEGLDLKDTSNPYSRATLAAVSLYLLSGPARIIFDFTLGCSVLTRIYELRHAILTDETNEAREQNEALILLSRRILLYIALSTLMNVIIYIPQTPNVGSGWTITLQVGSIYHFTLAIMTFWCFYPKASLAIPAPAQCVPSLPWLKPRRRRQSAEPLPQPPTRHPMFCANEQAAAAAAATAATAAAAAAAAAAAGGDEGGSPLSSRLERGGGAPEARSNEGAAATLSPTKGRLRIRVRQQRRAGHVGAIAHAGPPLDRMSEEPSSAEHSSSSSPTAAAGGGGPLAVANDDNADVLLPMLVEAPPDRASRVGSSELSRQRRTLLSREDLVLTPPRPDLASGSRSDGAAAGGTGGHAGCSIN